MRKVLCLVEVVFWRRAVEMDGLGKAMGGSVSCGVGCLGMGKGSALCGEGMGWEKERALLKVRYMNLLPETSFDGHGG